MADLQFQVSAYQPSARALQSRKWPQSRGGGVMVEVAVTPRGKDRHTRVAGTGKTLTAVVTGVAVGTVAAVCLLLKESRFTCNS